MQTINVRLLKVSLLSALTGVLAGLTTTVFLLGLNSVTRTRDLNPSLILFLPFAGLVIGYGFSRYAKNQRLEGPLILLSTWMTHLFGGSAGREKTAVQLGSWASNRLCKWLKLSSEETKNLLIAGTGAGFGSAVGAPCAGAIFALEGQGKKLNISSLWIGFVASATATLVTRLLGVPHTIYPAPHFFSFSFNHFVSISIAGLCFGIAGFLFTKTYQHLERLLKKTFKSPWWRSFAGGIFLVCLFTWEGSYRYLGLGIPLIQESFYQPSPLRDVFFKVFFTALTLASGFRGGEFIPLVFIGTALGSFLSQWLPSPTNLLSAVGFSAVFGAVTRTPLTCSLVALELFGLPIAPYAFLSCYLSYFCFVKLRKSGTSPSP